MAAVSDTKQDPSLALVKKLLTTDEAPVERRLDYWLQLVCSVYCELQCQPPEHQAIFGRIEFCRVGDLCFTHLRSNGRRIWRTPQRIRTSHEDYCLVLVQRAGKAIVRQDGREALLGPGDFVFNDCTRPYELLFDDTGHALCVLRLARAQLESHVGNLEELTATTVPGRSAAGQLLLAMVDALERDVDHLHPSSALGVSEGITSIIGAGLRSLPGANVRKPSNLTAYHVARIKAYVKDRLRDPGLSLASIAAAMNLSPDHVCKLFRDNPVPLSRLIWQQRLEACRRDLADPRLSERSVSDIAFSWGFNDAAHFSRSFREQYGVSPREWRHGQPAAFRAGAARR